MDDEKHSRRETDDDLEVEDLDVGVTEDAAEQVRGGAKAQIPAARAAEFSSEPETGTGRPG